MVSVDQFVFTPIDRELIPSQSATIEHIGNRSYLSGHLYLGRAVDNVIALASLEISRPNLPRVRLFNSKFDLCGFLKNTYKSKFLQQFHYRFVTFTNVQPSCPLKPVSRAVGTSRNFAVSFHILHNESLLLASQLHTRALLHRRTHSARAAARVQLLLQSGISGKDQATGQYASFWPITSSY